MAPPVVPTKESVKKTDVAKEPDPPQQVKSLEEEEKELDEVGKDLRKTLDEKPSETPPAIKPPEDEETAPVKSHHDSMRDKLDDKLEW